MQEETSNVHPPAMLIIVRRRPDHLCLLRQRRRDGGQPLQVLLYTRHDAAKRAILVRCSTPRTAATAAAAAAAAEAAAGTDGRRCRCRAECG